MELIYRNDIRWQDLPKIESPFFAQSKVEDDLTSPLPDITSGIGRNPLSKIVDDYSGKVNNDALKKLLTKIEEGAVVLVHFSVDDVFRPVFKWEKDDQHPNKGYWSINNCYDTQALFEFEWVLRTVKKPQPRGSVVRSTGDALFPGANTADSQRAVVNTGIESVNTLTDSARKRELDEYADRYPQLQSNASNPLEIDKLEYDNKPYGEFAETMVGVAGVLGTRNPSKLLKGGKGKEKLKDIEAGKKQTGVGYFKGSADEAYDAIRASTTDIATIAKNTGIKAKNIQKVKQHIFHDEHLLDRYVDYGVPAEMRRFDSDIGIANAWKRLENGAHTEDDIKLLKHEIAEAWSMNKKGPSYSKAHDIADKRYPAPKFGDE